MVIPLDEVDLGEGAAVEFSAGVPSGDFEHPTPRETAANPVYKPNWRREIFLLFIDNGGRGAI